MLSATDPSNNVATAKQQEKGQPDKVSVPCSQMICRYNHGMCGTDIMDQLTKTYVFDQKSPAKYYMRPFYDYLELGMANALIIWENLAAQRRDEKLCPNKDIA